MPDSEFEIVEITSVRRGAFVSLDQWIEIREAEPDLRRRHSIKNLGYAAIYGGLASVFIDEHLLRPEPPRQITACADTRNA
jgi:hypothetical protein